jgi:hypothetical protein
VVHQLGEVSVVNGLFAGDFEVIEIGLRNQAPIASAVGGEPGNLL